MQNETMNFKCNISLNTIFLTLGIFLMAVSELFANIISNNFSYIDEIFTVACTIILVYFVITKKKMLKHLVLFFIILFIGCMGNFLGNIQGNARIIINDIFLFSKPYLLFFYVLTTLTNKQAEKIYNWLIIFSKIFVVIISFSCVITLFKPSIMIDDGRFRFYGLFQGAISNWTILFLSIINSKKNKMRFFYYILCIIIVIFTASGLGMLCIVGSALSYIFIEKSQKFKWYYLLFIIPICLWTGRNEIISYLINQNAPRYKLFYYAFITAKNFFPIGSGFATYASTMAISNYSLLYTEYKFNNIWGMSSENSAFLMDSYYPQIIGQFGILGTITYIIFIYSIFKQNIIIIKNSSLRCNSIFLFATWIIAGIGFGTSSAWGCTVYIILAIYYLVNGNKINENK